MKLEQLVYISAANALPSEAVFADIVRESVRNNAPNNVTGVLTWSGSHFVQILEGSPGSLDVLMLKLICDPRHHAIEVLDRRPVRDRAFGRWAMIAQIEPLARARVAQMVRSGERSLDAWQTMMLALVDQRAALLPTAPAAPSL